MLGTNAAERINKSAQQRLTPWLGAVAGCFEYLQSAGIGFVYPRGVSLATLPLRPVSPSPVELLETLDRSLAIELVAHLRNRCELMTDDTVKIWFEFDRAYVVPKAIVRFHMLDGMRDQPLELGEEWNRYFDAVLGPWLGPANLRINATLYWPTAHERLQLAALGSNALGSIPTSSGAEPCPVAQYELALMNDDSIAR